MAQRPASRHGRCDAVLKSIAAHDRTMELPPQPEFRSNEVKDTSQTRENSLIQRKHSGGPVTAVHMFNIPTDKSYDARYTSKVSRPLSRESDESYFTVQPHPPSSPRQSRPGSARRRSVQGFQPQSASRRSSKDSSNSEEIILPQMAIIRPQSSIGKYRVLPGIGSGPESEVHHVLRMPTDGDTVNWTDNSLVASVEHSRGKEEIDSLRANLERQATILDLQSSKKELHDKSTYIHSESRRQSEAVYSSYINDSFGLSANSSSGDATESVLSKTQHKPEFSSQTYSKSKPNSSPAVSGMSERTYSTMDVPLKPSGEGQIMLGIKIPTDGTRHKQYFSQHDELRSIIQFAEKISGKEFINHILVLSNPRRQFCDLSQTIAEAGLENKSVLHLEEIV